MFIFNSSTMSILVYPVDLYQNTLLTNVKASKRTTAIEIAWEQCCTDGLKSKLFFLIAQWCIGTQEVETGEFL